EANARALIEAAGIATNEINLFHLNFDEAIEAIEQGRIDIVFFTSGYPNAAVKIITRNNGVYFFEPESELLERVLSMSPFFVVTTIPARTYAGQDEDITTLGVPALLVARSDLDPHLGYQLAKIVFADKSIRKNIIPKGVPILLHQGAYQFYQEKGLYRWKLLELAGLSVLLLSIIGFVILKSKDIVFFFKKRIIARVIVLVVGIWIAGSILLYLSEHLVNESYMNPWKAIWSSLINWLNFGSKEPITTTGRVVSVVMIVLGAGCIAWLTAEIASIFVAKKLGGKLMTKHIRDHYVIINWNNKGGGIIAQLRDPEVEQESIFVMTKKKDPPPCISAFKSVHHFHDINIGDSVLQQVKLHEAKAIIILADETLSYDAADAETILILLAIWKQLGSKDRHPKIIAEILQPQRVELAKYAGILEDGSVEIVSSMKLVQNLIAQVAITPGLTRVYDDLLTFGSHSNEIYGCELSKIFAGRRFEEIARLALDLREKNMHFIPIAIYRNKKTYINPTRHEIARLEEKDILYAICGDRKSFKKSLKMIANIFAAKPN
ncbi:MAG: TAXI family TRAP transporter solute-binding subunit, partial [Candidatus Aminicenantes bacterium]|nr:TAXI family TRAP transporter solute-binding subunit [Candidatus Aminicenantes bacterium]